MCTYLHLHLFCKGEDDEITWLFCEKKKNIACVQTRWWKRLIVLLFMKIVCFISDVIISNREIICSCNYQYSYKNFQLVFHLWNKLKKDVFAMKTDFCLFSNCIYHFIGEERQSDFYSKQTRYLKPLSLK